MFSVLLVDDEPLVLEGLKLLVDWEGYGFRICGEAGDGEDACALIAQHNPDLVVTDLRMPIIDGIQLIRHCVDHLQTRCRFIILSGHEDFSAAQQALSLGVIDYWLKPLDTDEIHRTLAVLREEWKRRAADIPAYRSGTVSPEINESSIAESVPSALNEALCAAEDELLLAIEEADDERIVANTNRLLQLAFSSTPSIAACKSYISNMLLELVLKTDDGVTKDNVPVTPAFLNDDPETWREPLTAYCRAIAARLSQQRTLAGPAGEAVRFIRRNYNKPLKLHDVAKSLHFQPAYMGQLFRKVTGMSFLDCLHRTRIEEACKLLRRTDRKIADIARAVGYSDAELFAEKFKKYMSVPPSQYKK